MNKYGTGKDSQHLSKLPIRRLLLAVSSGFTPIEKNSQVNMVMYGTDRRTENAEYSQSVHDSPKCFSFFLFVCFFPSSFHAFRFSAGGAAGSGRGWSPSIEYAYSAPGIDLAIFSSIYVQPVSLARANKNVGPETL